jgi:hypothetical protein
MSRKIWITLISLAFLVGAGGAFGDDVQGADRILCATVSASECFADGSCIDGEPEDWNIPRFIRVNLDEQTMSTTEASGQARSTPIQSVERQGDRLLIQGVQDARAFSVVLNESTGLASTGIALDGHVLNTFAHCTPEVGGE